MKRLATADRRFAVDHHLAYLMIQRRWYDLAVGTSRSWVRDYGFTGNLNRRPQSCETVINTGFRTKFTVANICAKIYILRVNEAQIMPVSY